MGYGAALQTGFSHAKYEWICETDGDDHDDIKDLKELVNMIDCYDLVITFRQRLIYSIVRIVFSKIYNLLIRLLFHTNFRNLSRGLRLVKKEFADKLALKSISGFFGSELAIK